MNKVKKHRDFTVVIGSGGIKPIAAVPFFLFLEEYQLEPKLIIACSGGTYVSCFWVNGARTEKELVDKLNFFINSVVNDKLFGSIDYRSLLSVPGYPMGRFSKKHGILFNDKLLKMFKELSGNTNLEDLPIKTILAATDLETGDPVFIEKGDMATGICASTALYPLLPPVAIDGKLLVDGGYRSELPLMEAVKRSNHDVIIALEFDQPRAYDQDSFLNFFTNFIQRVLHNHTHIQNSFAVNLHQSEIIFAKYHFNRPIKIWDVKDLDYVMELGHKVLNEKKQEILDVLFQE